MILNEYVDQKVFRTAYRQWVTAKDEQALISFHEAGFFRELQQKRIKRDKMDEKAIDGWFRIDYVLDLAKGTETQYIVIGQVWCQEPIRFSSYRPWTSFLMAKISSHFTIRN